MRIFTTSGFFSSLLLIILPQTQALNNSTESLERFGWTAVPHSQHDLLKNISPWDAANFTVSEIGLPRSDLVTKTIQYAKERLPSQTFNHSMRVYFYGAAIAKKHLPSFVPSLETYLLTSLLHDIGTTEDNLHATHLSFEFYGGYLALDQLQKYGAPKEQAESVTEAIIRHQDLGDIGTITTVGQLIQLSTLFDNVGGNPTLISRETIESVVAAYPRGHWSSCFALKIKEELNLKPWAHTSAIANFAEDVQNNKLMEPFDGGKVSTCPAPE